MNNTNNEGVQPSTIRISGDSVKKSKKKRNPFLGTLSKARKVFERQIERSAPTKKSAIFHVLKLTGQDVNNDDRVFLANFYDLVYNRLLDSARFKFSCNSLKVDAFAVAQHIAFDGDKCLNEVLKFGVEKVYGNELMKMTEPIFTKEELESAKLSSSGCGDAESQMNPTETGQEFTNRDVA